MNKLKAFWASLPHQVQALLILFGTGASTTLAKELQAYLAGTLSFSVSSLEHDLGMAIVSGLTAVRVFYMLPNRDVPPTSPVTPLPPA